MNINQITVPSLDLTKSITFYQKLGLKLIVNSTMDYARFECPDGDSTFSLHRVKELPTGDGVYVYFECENLVKYVDKLVRVGIEFEELPKDKSWLWQEARLTKLVSTTF